MDKKPLEAFQQFWGQALVTLTGAEEEAARLLGRVQGLAGWSQEEARRQVREFSERLAGQRREIEKRVEDTVKQSVSRLRLPRHAEVSQLTTRLDALARRVENLSK
jgi:polyhydroxyalkanoate synthesis regulator phasin